MWIEYKSDGIVGPARIGWVIVKDKGKRLQYGNQPFALFEERDSRVIITIRKHETSFGSQAVGKMDVTRSIAQKLKSTKMRRKNTG